MTELKEILVIGGTGAQGSPVVESLANSKRYKVRVLTRNPDNVRAQKLAALPNVTLIQGTSDNQKDLERAFKGVYGAWVNLDGFTLGEKAETFYGLRAYEIARCEGVQHYVWAGADYAVKVSGWKKEYHWGHNDAKGRVSEYILAQGQEGMKSSIITTGPYMDMLSGGLLVPAEQPDGTLVFANPGNDGKIPLIAVEDMGVYSMWLFDNVEESAGLNLYVETDRVSFPEIARAVTEVTGKKSFHQKISFEDWFAVAEPYPNAPSNFFSDPTVPRDESFMTFRENFTPWWRFWGDGLAVQRDTALLDRIHPNRIKSVGEWMKKTGYKGKGDAVLKGVQDLEKTLGKKF